MSDSWVEAAQAQERSEAKSIIEKAGQLSLSGGDSTSSWGTQSPSKPKNVGFGATAAGGFAASTFGGGATSSGSTFGGGAGGGDTQSSFGQPPSSFGAGKGFGSFGTKPAGSPNQNAVRRPNMVPPSTVTNPRPIIRTPSSPTAPKNLVQSFSNGAAGNTNASASQLASNSESLDASKQDESADGEDVGW